MLVFFIICILILTLFGYTFSLGVDVETDVLNNKGAFKVYLGFIRVFKGKAYLKHEDIRRNNLIIEHGKKKNEVHLSTDKKDKKSIASFLSVPLFNYAHIKYIACDFKVGNADNALLTTLLLGGIRVGFYSIASYIKSRQKIDISENFIPFYNENIFHAAVSGIITISIADIIYSLTGYFFKRIYHKKLEAERA